MERPGVRVGSTIPKSAICVSSTETLELRQAFPWMPWNSELLWKNNASGSASRLKKKRKFVSLDKCEKRGITPKKNQIVARSWKGKSVKGVMLEETSGEWEAESEEFTSGCFSFVAGPGISTSPFS